MAKKICGKRSKGLRRIQTAQPALKIASKALKSASRTTGSATKRAKKAKTSAKKAQKKGKIYCVLQRKMIRFQPFRSGSPSQETEIWTRGERGPSSRLAVAQHRAKMKCWHAYEWSQAMRNAAKHCRSSSKTDLAPGAKEIFLRNKRFSKFQTVARCAQRSYFFTFVHDLRFVALPCVYLPYGKRRVERIGRGTIVMIKRRKFAPGNFWVCIATDDKEHVVIDAEHVYCSPAHLARHGIIGPNRSRYEGCKKTRNVFVYKARWGEKKWNKAEPSYLRL